MLVIQLALAAPLHSVTELTVQVETQPVPAGPVVPLGPGGFEAIATCTDGSYYGVIGKGTAPSDVVHIGPGGLARVTLDTTDVTGAATCLTDGTLAFVHNDLMATASHIDRWKAGEPKILRWSWDMGTSDGLIGLFDIVALPDGGFAVAGRSQTALGDLPLSVQDGERSIVSAFNADGSKKFAYEMPRDAANAVYFDDLGHLSVHGDRVVGLWEQGESKERVRRLVEFTEEGMQLVEAGSFGDQWPVADSFEASAAGVRRAHVRLGSAWDPKFRVRALSVEWWSGGRAAETQTNPLRYDLSTLLAGAVANDDDVFLWGTFRGAMFGTEEPLGNAAFVARFRRGEAPAVHAWTGAGDQRIDAGAVLPDGRLVLGFSSTKPVEVRGTLVPGGKGSEASFIVGSFDALP